MKILAFDSSSDWLAAGIYDNGKALAEEHLSGFARHSENLAPALERLMKKARTSLKDIDLIAVGTGPGSFTGLRVGLATAKMLAFAANKNCIGIPSTEIIAASQSPDQDLVMVILDAKRNQVYAAVKGRKPEVVSRALVSERAPKGGLVAAFTPLGDTVLRELESKSCRIIANPRSPQGSSIAKIALALASKKKFTRLEDLKPLYLHPKDCNVTLKK